MVQFDPEAKQIGLDGDEEHMVACGFTSKELIHSPSRRAFFLARQARDEADGGKWRHYRKRDGDILWVKTDAPDFANDVFKAIRLYVERDLNTFYLETDPPFDPNALEYKNALAAREKATKAIVDLSIIDAQLRVNEAAGSQPSPG